MTPERPPGPSEETASPNVRIETCELHGLRYNAAVDDGCARCRTERGGRTMERSGFAAQRPPDLKRGLLVAAALVAAIGGGLFVAHTVAYQAGRAMLDEAFDELAEDPEEDYEEAFEELFGDG